MFVYMDSALTVKGIALDGSSIMKFFMELPPIFVVGGDVIPEGSEFDIEPFWNGG